MGCRVNSVVVERVRSIIKFALVPGFSMVTTILVLPLISAQFGTGGIVALNLGQSIGALASVAVGMGWPVVGANAVAGVGKEGRELVCLDSLLSRGLVFAVLLLPTVLAAFWISPVHKVAALLFAFGTLLNGFTFAWYYAGVNRPRLLVRNEALMRLGGNVIAIPVLWATKSLYAYAGLLILIGFGMLAMNSVGVLSRQVIKHVSWSRAVTQTRAQLPLTGARIVTAAGYYLTAPIVSTTSKSILGMYSASDKMQKSLGNATEAIPSGLAGWVSAAPEGSSQRARRVGNCVWFCIAVACFIVLGWMLVGGWVTDLLFHGTVVLSVWAQMANGVAIAAAFVASAMAQLAMVPSGKVHVVARLSPLAAVVGLALTAVGARFGVSWALLGACSSNLIQAAVYLIVTQAWLKTMRRPRRAAL